MSGENEALVHSGATTLVLTGAKMVMALEEYKDLQRSLDNSMPDQLMTIGDKKFRKKGYWRAIRVAFNLSVEPIEERREVSGLFDDNRENFGYIVTYRATGPNGSSATGDGACFAIEKAVRFRCPHPEKEGSTRTLHWPAENCPEFANHNPWVRLSAQATEHNIRSHAHTRAMNRAISNLVGFGEVSAEEVEHDTTQATETTKSAGSGSTQQAAAKPVTSADGSTKVKDVKRSTAEKKPSWVVFEDGRELSTFDSAIIDKADEAKAGGWTVIPKIAEKGKYKNLTGLERVIVQEQALPLEDTEPVGGPEKVLFVQEAIRKDKPKAWKIQTDKRFYFTEIEGHSVIAKGAKDNAQAIVVEFEVRQGEQGSYNFVTGVKEAA